MTEQLKNPLAGSLTWTPPCCAFLLHACQLCEAFSQTPTCEILIEQLICAVNCNPGEDQCPVCASSNTIAFSSPLRILRWPRERGNNEPLVCSGGKRWLTKGYCLPLCSAALQPPARTCRRRTAATPSWCARSQRRPCSKPARASQVRHGTRDTCCFSTHLQISVLEAPHFFPACSRRARHSGDGRCCVSLKS